MGTDGSAEHTATAAAKRQEEKKGWVLYVLFLFTKPFFFLFLFFIFQLIIRGKIRGFNASSPASSAADEILRGENETFSVVLSPSTKCVKFFLSI